MQRAVWYWLVCATGALAIWMVKGGCAPPSDGTCRTGADCASGSCDPATRRCAIPPGERQTEPPRQEITTAEPVAESVQQETPAEFPIRPRESTGDAGAADRPINETIPDTSAPDNTRREIPPEIPAKETIPESPPVIQGPCQSKTPKCPPRYICRDEDTPPQCHLQCDPARKGTCPLPHLCQLLSSGEGICVTGQEVAQGAACDNSRICAPGLICVRASATTPDGVCYPRCTLDQLTCPAGQFCFLVHSRNGVCLAGQAGSKGEGATCTKTSECAGGLICFTPYQQSARCANLCDTQHPCPTGQRCANIEGAPADAGACVR